MSGKKYHQVSGALDLSAAWFRSIAGLWLLSIALLSFVSVDPTYAGPKQSALDAPMHAAIFGALILIPGLIARARSTLTLALIAILALAIGLEAGQAWINDAGLESPDVAANLVGAGAGLALAAIIRRRVRRLRSGARARPG